MTAEHKNQVFFFFFFIEKDPLLFDRPSESHKVHI